MTINHIWYRYHSVILRSPLRFRLIRLHVILMWSYVETAVNVYVCLCSVCGSVEPQEWNSDMGLIVSRKKNRYGKCCEQIVRVELIGQASSIWNNLAEANEFVSKGASSDDARHSPLWSRWGAAWRSWAENTLQFKLNIFKTHDTGWSQQTAMFSEQVVLTLRKTHLQNRENGSASVSNCVITDKIWMDVACSLAFVDRFKVHVLVTVSYLLRCTAVLYSWSTWTMDTISTDYVAMKFD